MVGVDWNALAEENEELARQLSDPTVVQDTGKFGRIARRKKELDELLGLRERLETARVAVVDTEQIATGDEPALRELAQEELPARRKELAALETELTELTRPRDPADRKPAIVEIRAGAGGDEASLFAKELYGMYARFAETRGFSTELLATSASGVDGFKEVIFRIGGPEAFGLLRNEGGTHRVQRVPVTESGGRIHTSTATVAVLPEAEEAELELKPEELRIDVFRSSGPGGQSVNTTDSAVRITHLPTGITVSCQDEKSQHKNRAKAMQILRARLKAKQDAEAAAARGDIRRSQVGSGDRSEKIRTYNVPQDRVTDHRIKRSFPNVKGILSGGLEPVIAAVREAALRDE